MSYEDDLSYLTGKYYEAKIRQSDYERYYILAARYGPYNEIEFNKGNRSTYVCYVYCVQSDKTSRYNLSIYILHI